MSKKFEKLVTEARETARKAAELDRPHKLSARAFLRDAMNNAHTDADRLKRLRDCIENESGFSATRSFLRNSVKWLREMSIVRATADVGRLSWLGNKDAVQSELATLQSSILELFALGVQVATERFPEAFGDLESWDLHLQAVQETKAKLQALYKRIATEFDPSDLLIGPVGADGRAKISFACSGGEVPIAPVETAGTRLIAWCLQH